MKGGKKSWGDQERALVRAANLGDAKEVERAIAQGADVCSNDPSGWTPLMYAVYGQHPGIVDRLLAAGADVNQATRDGMSMTPLMWAVKSFDERLVRKLIVAGADVNARNIFCWSPLLQDEDGQTALLKAVWKGNVRTVALLLDSGADINVADKCHDTPHEIAVMKGNKKIIGMLEGRVNPEMELGVDLGTPAMG